MKEYEGVETKLLTFLILAVRSRKVGRFKTRPHLLRGKIHCYPWTGARVSSKFSLDTFNKS